MAIKPNSKGKVTGTKKKDKITWLSSKAWKKALTVNAGAGNDVINFKKSKYNNTLNGQDGKDIIYGGTGADKITGGKQNDTINAGKGKNTLYFSKGDGTDTVLNGKGTDTLVFKTEKNINNIKVAYSGNNAVITYTNGKVILKDYKKGNHSAKTIQVGKTKKAIADYFVTPTPQPQPDTPTIPQEPANIVDGYYVVEGNDSLTANDDYNCKITGGESNDSITGGKGNDVINAGAGENTIYLNKASNGNDTIISGGGTDTIVLPASSSFSNIIPMYLGNNLALAYTNGINILGTVTLENYLSEEHSVKNITINGITKTIEDVLPYNTVTREPGSHNLVGTNYKDSIVSNMYNDTIQAFAGNDYIEIQKGRSEITAGQGNDFIMIASSEDGNIAYFNANDGQDIVQYDREVTACRYVFSDETDISGLTLTINEGEGFTIGYNNNNDSVKTIMSDNQNYNFDAWKEEYNKYNYDNAYYDTEYNDYNVEVNNNKYQVTTKGFAPVTLINTDTLSTTNSNDYIYVENYRDNDNPYVTEIRTLDGDDYIHAVSYYDEETDETICPDIYAGQGNDTIVGYGINIHLNSGDGNDIIGDSESGTNCNSLIFEDETSVENLNITKEDDDILIQYNNNSDSVRVKDFETDSSLYIKIADEKYLLQRDGEVYGDYLGDITAILGTNGDDNIRYYYYMDSNNAIILGSGNDILTLSSYTNLGVLFNVDNAGNLLDNNLKFIDYYNQTNYRYDEINNENIEYQETTIYNSLTVKDYMLNYADKTICNNNEETLNTTADIINEVKSAVAGWLSTNYDDVASAINDADKGAENLAILLGSDYFGKLQFT